MIQYGLSLRIISAKDGAQIRSVRVKAPAALAYCPYLRNVHFISGRESIYGDEHVYDSVDKKLRKLCGSKEVVFYSPNVDGEIEFSNEDLVFELTAVSIYEATKTVYFRGNVAEQNGTVVFGSIRISDLEGKETIFLPGTNISAQNESPVVIEELGDIVSGLIGLYESYSQ